MEAIKNLRLTENDFQQIIIALDTPDHKMVGTEMFEQALQRFQPLGGHNKTFIEKMRELHKEKEKERLEKEDAKNILKGKIVLLKQELLKNGAIKTESADCSK